MSGKTSPDPRMSKLTKWMFFYIPGGAFLFILAVHVLLILSILWRLHFNGGIADNLVDELRRDFPNFKFYGVPSYESEIIYISTQDEVVPDDRKAIEQFLRNLKKRDSIAPEIRLRFYETDSREEEEISF